MCWIWRKPERYNMSYTRYLKRRATDVVIDRVGKTASYKDHYHPYGGVRITRTDEHNASIGWCLLHDNDMFSYDKARLIMNERAKNEKYHFNPRDPDSVYNVVERLPRQLRPLAYSMIEKNNVRGFIHNAVV